MVLPLPAAMMILRRGCALTLGWLALAGLAWGGGDLYQSVMGKDQEFCTAILDVFNRAVDWEGKLRYEHEIFRRIAWTPVNLSGQAPLDGRCSTLEQARFDINNDGREDLVVRSSFCMRGSPSDSFYVFPPDSKVLEQATWQDLSPLHATADKFERTGGAYALKELPVEETRRNAAPPAGVFALRPFIFNQTSYISLTDARRTWIVIAKFLHGDRLQDVCYLYAPSRDIRSAQ